MFLISNKGRDVDETSLDVCSFCFVYNSKIHNKILITKTALTKLLENTLDESSKLKNMPDDRLRCPAKSLLTLSPWWPISYKNQPIYLQSKTMDWFLYDIGLRRERVKSEFLPDNVRSLENSYFTPGIYRNVSAHEMLFLIHKCCPLYANAVFYISM